jgi:hypothetical protein
MFWSLFASKNQKLVKKWQKEHEEIVVLAHKVIGEYSKNNHDAAKEALQELNNIAVDHIMSEDIEFYRLLKDEKRFDEKTKKMIHDFTVTFKDMKLTLMHFLTKYAKPETPLDAKFFKTFNEIVEVLGDRIAFEENNLYSKMSAD